MTGKKAVAYIRAVGRDRNAIDEQKRLIENAAFEEEYELVDSYIDTGDGADLERRGIESLLEDVKDGRIDAVFVNSAETLSTDKMNMSELLEMLSTLKVGVYSVDGRRYLNKPLDTLSNLSREIYNTLSEMKQNGVSLREDAGIDEKAAEKDPALKFQSRVVKAYLEIQNDRRPQV